MNIKIDLSKTILQEQNKQDIQIFCESLVSVTGNPVQSIVLYGSAARTDYLAGVSDINLLIIVERADTAALQALIEPVTKGRAAGISPLFLTASDLLKFSSAFSLKYLSIHESHQTLYGDDPVAGMEISHESLRLRCRQELLNLRMRLRRNYLYSMGHHLAGFLVHSVKGFLELLRLVLYIENNQLPQRDGTIDAAANLFGNNMNVVREILGMKESKLVPEEKIVQTLYDQYSNLIEDILTRF